MLQEQGVCVEESGISPVTVHHKHCCHFMKGVQYFHTWSNGICVCQVLVEFSPSNAVPGEENTLHLSARPGSLCGLSAVDQSVGIMEPGKRLDADKVTQLTEVNNSGTTIPTVLVVLGIQPVTTADMEWICSLLGAFIKCDGTHSLA